jgi:hypothetical protein
MKIISDDINNLFCKSDLLLPINMDLGDETTYSL